MVEALLSGVRVIDLSSWLAGPVAGLLLAEAGADVVKVEPPVGDPARSLAGFATWNRSKRSVVLDLNSDGGRQSLQRLLASADVLLHSLRPSRARALSLDDDSLAEHEGLVWCSITGWPYGHPDQDRPGYDILAQAVTGVMDEEVGARPGPVYLRFPFPSWNAAFLATVGILARLQVRDRTGQGGPVHTSLFQGAIAPMTKHWGRSAHPTPAMSAPNLAKGRNRVMMCGDGLGMIAPGAIDLSGVALFKQVLDELPPEVATDPVRSEVEALKRRTRSEWLEAMWAADVAVVPVAPHIGSALLEEQARVNGYAIEVEDPVWGRVVQAGHPFRVDPPLAVQRPAPRLGEHTDEVLTETETTDAPRPRPRPGGSGLAPLPRSPLEGVKVLDFGMMLAGPYGPQLMADLGAEVIKVEAATGDRVRGAERVFAGCNRGKRSLAIDLRSPASRPVLQALVEWADVVHHNLRMPPARLLGLGYEDVRAVKPDIIYCHVSSYGPEGPRKDWPGVDPTSQAVTGWIQEGSGPGNPPRMYRIGMTDDQCAMLSVVAVLLALRRRDQTGEGSDVRVSILGGATLTTSETMVMADGSFAAYPAYDADQTGLGPGYRIFECADGWAAVAALGDEQLAALDRVSAQVRSRPLSQVLEDLDAAGVPAAAVSQDHEDAFFDSETNRRLGLSAVYEHAQYGQLEQIGALWGFGDLSLRLDRAPPVLGQHSGQMLAELGFDQAAVARLAQAGLLAGPGLP